LYALMIALVLGLASCQTDQGPGSYVADSKVDGLPNVQLIDQNGQKVALSSLKGKPVLIDFIYTSCKGPCPMLTAKFAMVANLLRFELGKQVTMVSLTVDPEHDQPAQLKDYAMANRAQREGWYFLTGSPADVEKVLDAYKIKRMRESDDSVTHMTSFFLLGPDGHELRIYDGLQAKPTAVTADILRALG
jgi:protein SCO1/2